MSTKTLDQHIEITPGVCGGKARIAGRRIRVQDIVAFHLRWGQPVDEIAHEYELDRADIYAALAYYFDHREEIDREISGDEAFVEEMRRQHPSLLRRKLDAGD